MGKWAQTVMQMNTGNMRKETDLSVAEIAGEVGIFDYNHFSGLFKTT